MSETTYSIGSSRHLMLRWRATEGWEQKALDRLLDFRGSEADLRIAAALHARHEERDEAADLLRILDTPPGGG